jgi:molybdopterin/thiamine biosynthesis adenylyltransferase
MVLSSEEARRYARQIVLKGFGGSGQQALKAARVLVVGAGGLGSPAIAYLAGAGVGVLGIADPDQVALSNFHRQIIHEDHLGLGKVESAARFVARLNPHVSVEPIPMAITDETAPGIVSRYDLVLDGTDNLAARRAVAAACETAKIPLVCGAVSGFDGQVTVFAPHLTRPDGRPAPRFADLYGTDLEDADLPSCEVTGILGPVTGVIGTLMAMEAIKLSAGIGDPLIGRLLIYEGLAGRTSELAL